MVTWIVRFKKWLTTTTAEPGEQIEYLRQLKAEHLKEAAEISEKINALMLEEFLARTAVLTSSSTPLVKTKRCGCQKRGCNG